MKKSCRANLYKIVYHPHPKLDPVVFIQFSYIFSEIPLQFLINRSSMQTTQPNYINLAATLIFSITTNEKLFTMCYFRTILKFHYLKQGGMLSATAFKIDTSQELVCVESLRLYLKR